MFTLSIHFSQNPLLSQIAKMAHCAPVRGKFAAHMHTTHRRAPPNASDTQEIRKGLHVITQPCRVQHQLEQAGEDVGDVLIFRPQRASPLALSSGDSGGTLAHLWEARVALASKSERLCPPAASTSNSRLDLRRTLAEPLLPCKTYGWPKITVGPNHASPVKIVADVALRSACVN